MLYKIKNILLLSLVVGLMACPRKKEEPGPEVDFDELAMLTNVADNIILYNYGVLETSIDGFNVSINNYETNATSENLVKLKEAYIDLGLKWNTVASYQFGPAENVVLSAIFNTYPVNTSLIESNITSGSYNLDAVSNHVATGLNSLDYLLYGDSVLSANRLTYVKAIASQMETNIAYVVGKWNSEYRNAFISNVGTQNGSSISVLMNGIVNYMEVRLRNGKIRIPAGIFNANLVDTTRVEGRFSRTNSIDFFLAGFNGVYDLFCGTSNSTSATGVGLKDYVASYNSTVLGSDVLLVDQIAVEKNQIINLATSLNDTSTLIDLLQSDRNSMVSLHDELQDLIGLLKIDVTSVLKVAITYSDTDGD